MRALDIQSMCLIVACQKLVHLLLKPGGQGAQSVTCVAHFIVVPVRWPDLLHVLSCACRNTDPIGYVVCMKTPSLIVCDKKCCIPASAIV